MTKAQYYDSLLLKYTVFVYASLVVFFNLDSLIGAIPIRVLYVPSSTVFCFILSIFFIIVLSRYKPLSSIIGSVIYACLILSGAPFFTYMYIFSFGIYFLLIVFICLYWAYETLIQAEHIKQKRSLILLLLLTLFMTLYLQGNYLSFTGSSIENAKWSSHNYYIEYVKENFEDHAQHTFYRCNRFQARCIEITELEFNVINTANY